MRFCVQIFFIIFVFANCSEPVFTPKPRAFPKVEYPAKEYQSFDKNYCGFTFEFPTYALIQQDSTFFDVAPEHSCWFDMYIPDFDCKIHCSYHPITAERPFEKLKDDAFKMTDWHNKKATYIEERPFIKRNNVKGIVFEVEGPVASPFQFFVTDSLEQKHFFRGSLYFNAQVRPDSLAPVYSFIKEDLLQIIETFKWTD